MTPSQPDPDFARRVAALHAAQRDGVAPPPGAISRARLAAHLGLSEATVRKVEAVAKAKLVVRLRALGIDAGQIFNP